MPFFSAHGVETYAISLRAHGGSDPVHGATCTLAQQLSDVASVVASLSVPPILVGHSLGGLIVQR